MSDDNRVIDNRIATESVARTVLQQDSERHREARERLLEKSRTLRQLYDRGEVDRATASRFASELLNEIDRIDESRGIILECQHDMIRKNARRGRTGNTCTRPSR